MDDDAGIAAARERGWRQLADIDAAFTDGRIDRAAWHAAVLALVETAYLAGDNPRAQSGHSGDAARWRHARSLLVDTLPDHFGAPITVLDVGCANGHLMECWTAWATEAGHRVEPFGVEISPALAALARRRCPQWAHRIWTGNAFDWSPPRRFDVVRTGLDYVPASERGPYLAHLLDHTVAPAGRLVIGVCNEEADAQTLESQVRALGYTVGGRVHRPHRHPAIRYKAFWIDQAA